MQTTADVSKVSKTVQSDLNFILNVLSEFSICFSEFLIVLAKKNVISFIENEAVVLCVTMPERARAFAATV